MQKAFIKITVQCPECGAELLKLPDKDIQVNCKECGNPIIISGVKKISEVLRLLDGKFILPFVGGKE